MKNRIEEFRIEIERSNSLLARRAECTLRFVSYNFFGTYIGSYNVMFRFCLSDDAGNSLVVTTVNTWLKDWDRLLKFQNIENAKIAIASALLELDIEKTPSTYEAQFS